MINGAKFIVFCFVFLASFILLAQTDLFAFTLEVKDAAGNPVSGFRWLVEEDTTDNIVPGEVVTSGVPSIDVRKSYAPVVAKGHTDGDSVVIDLPDDVRYMVSVLPDEGHTLSGANVGLGQTAVTVNVNAYPIPTAQISIYAFHDNRPINNAPDIPAEEGLANFSVLLADAGGQVMQDAFGNMIGTTYQLDGDGNPILDGDGNPIVDQMGTGIIKTDANGEALVKYLAPGKYGVQLIPPVGEKDWIQTATIEGTPTVDAWVKADEPPYFAEWGVFEWHVFIGFVHPMTLEASDGPTSTITGQAVYTHQNRPPLSPGLNPGVPIGNAWVGLNNLSGNDEQVYAQPCDAEGNFTIENVPPGTYQLVVWDLDLDAIIDFRTVIVPAEGGLIEMGKVPVYAWFGNFEGKVFYDENENGYPDEGEVGIRDQAVNIRFPDGSIYQSTVTDPSGEYAFNEVFPFFWWSVIEVDFLRYKATGATIIVDDGGPIEEGAKNNPQLQPENSDLPWRTEIGEVLTQAMMLFADQTNEVHWGKAAYGPGENGGISGVVFYATTRAEDDPRYGVGEPWEPGVPRVQMNLYEDLDADEIIDDVNTSGEVELADVDNWPFGWFEGGEKGDEDIDHNDNGDFDYGDAIDITWTDSWSDNLPTGTVGPTQYVHGVPIMDGAETIATWNQIRPGVFDGGYAFGDLDADVYIVEACPPPGYEIVKEEDKNVDFGDQYIPAPGVLPILAPPKCVGDLHLVPDELTLFPGIEAPFAGDMRPLADRKQVLLTDGKNAAADFFVFTEVPKAGRIWGLVFNDVLLEFDPNSPNKGTNRGVGWIPISIRDFAGNEVARVYTDEWGRYNALVPSTYTVNVPSPSGVSPMILTVYLNDPGPIPDPENPGEFITDPYYRPEYGQIGTNWEFFPGKTTRLDTPVLPIGAFTANTQPLDCNYPDGTPVIQSVSGPGGGPYITAPDSTITITALGDTMVPDPDSPIGSPLITRDYGFGPDEGTITVGGVELENVIWAVDGLSISATVPEEVETGQLIITRGDNGLSTPVGITLHVNPTSVVHVNAGQSIQQAIDAASDNTLIIIGPGTYRENLIMWKPVKLQGYGAYSTIIQAGPMTPEEQAVWDAKLQALIASGDIVLITGERPDFYLERGAGIMVASEPGRFTSGDPALIDGLTIMGAVQGGGVFVNAYAPYLEVSNNKIASNEGSFGGGIRIGTPSLVNDTNTGYYGSNNQNIKIHHNHISENGAIDGGGGIAIFNGSDGYEITENCICGNFSLLYGGGIAHFGLSPGGIISTNKIVSNQAFDEGGGIIIAGELVPAGAPAATLTPGAGSVSVTSNLIQGNISGDDGGGIRTLMVNGQDVQNNPSSPNDWWGVEILNNTIVNNSSADVGGGISMDDTARIYIVNNTIAHNDSTATGVDAFGGPIEENNPPGQFLPPELEGGIGGLTTSIPQVAGIAANAHSTGLQDAFGPAVEQEFSDPVLDANIIWQNRSFYWDAAYNGDLGGLRPDIGVGEDPVFWDLAVYGTADVELMNPVNGVLTDLTITFPDGSTGSYDASNTDTDPGFVDPYFNDYQATSKGAAFGNFVTVTFLPTGCVGDYSITPGALAGGIGAVLDLPIIARIHITFAPEDYTIPTGDPDAPAPPEPPETGDIFIQTPPDDDGIDTDGDGIVDNDNVYMHLAAGDGFVTMADGTPMYMFGFDDVTGVPVEDVVMTAMLGGEAPAPTIWVREGQKLYLSLTNVGMMLRPDLFDAHTVHWHGFPQAAPIFDGMPNGSVAINMGSTFTYFYEVVDPGTYMYHCHVEVTEHMQMGMWGNLYVLPKQDMLPDGTDLNGFTHHTGYTYAYNDGDGSTYYDVDYPLQMNGYDPEFHEASLTVQPLPFQFMEDTYALLNGRGYPDTINPDPILNEQGRASQKVSSLIEAHRGEKILLRLSCLSATDYYTFTVLGMPMKVVGKSAKLLRGPDGKDLSYYTTSVTLGGGESVDVILDTADVAPGTYYAYTTNLNYLSNNEQDYGGIMTQINVLGIIGGEEEQAITE